MTAKWSEHTAQDGRTYYFDRVSGRSVWEKPAEAMAPHTKPTLQSCNDEYPAVASLLNAIVKYCGAEAVPTVASRTQPDDPLCTAGRGGAFCCASNCIYICSHDWVGCREIAYELSHALNTCRGMVRCSSPGMQIDGKDCGYLSPPDVACSEFAAADRTHRPHKSHHLPHWIPHLCMYYRMRTSVGCGLPTGQGAAKAGENACPNASNGTRAGR